MLSYNEFKKELFSRLTEKFSSDIVKEETVQKVNGSYEAITLRTPHSPVDIAPTFYYEKLYQDYSKGQAIDEIVKAMAHSYKNVAEKAELSKNIKTLMTENILDLPIIMHLVNAEKNRELLKKIPHRRFFDLAMIYRIELPEQSTDSYSTVVITDEMMKTGNFSEDDLYKKATTGSPVSVSNMGCLCLIKHDKPFFGSGAIFTEGFLDMLTDKIGEEIYLLPSSIHEILAISAGLQSEDELLAIVKTVNLNAVEEEDFLSNNVYKYSKSTGNFEIVYQKIDKVS